jgi:DNA-binding transcriptional MerR regulator/uncharacterized protein (DUF433 family)
MATTERTRGFQQLMEPGRGVYDTHRAAALSGVPRSTLHYWARTGLYTPSVSPEPRTRLWSWADLLALRAIDWFRKGDDGRAKASVANIRRALAEIETAGFTREALAHILAVSSAGGQLFLQLPDRTIRAHSGGQIAIADTLNLVAPYKNGPDLLRPRPLLQIIPGKLHGEPHIVDTRIPSVTIAALADTGYTLDQIRSMYPDASLDALQVAIEFERSLLSALAA